MEDVLGTLGAVGMGLDINAAGCQERTVPNLATK